MNENPDRAAKPGRPSLQQLFVAEALGTFLLILFGCGSVHAAVLTGAQSGLWQVAVVWGISIMLAIYTVGAISGAHINPAITLASAVWGQLPWRLVMPYMAAQVSGAFLAAAILFAIFSGSLAKKELEKGVVRGEPGSEITAMCYGEYFPNPGPIADAEGRYSADAHIEYRQSVPYLGAWVAEFVGTAILAFVVFAVTDDRNRGGPGERLAPVFIGLTVAALISVIAPLTQACFNPARDLGPRLFAFFAGWGTIALPGSPPSAWLVVYIIAPLAGAVAGAALYQRVIRPSLPCPG